MRIKKSKNHNLLQKMGINTKSIIGSTDRSVSVSSLKLRHKIVDSNSLQRSSAETRQVSIKGRKTYSISIPSPSPKVSSASTRRKSGGCSGCRRRKRT
jgi:hypothetical protein